MEQLRELFREAVELQLRLWDKQLELEQALGETLDTLGDTVQLAASGCGVTADELTDAELDAYLRVLQEG